MNISEKIRQLRKQKGLSQSKMAEVIGISQAAYAKIETGDTKSITIEIGKGIARALDVSFNELFEIETKGVNIELVEKLKSEIENFKRQLEEKSLLIDLLVNKIERTKDSLVSIMVEEFTWEIKDIQEQISKSLTEDEQLELFNKLERIDRFFNMNKDRFFKEGILLPSDFDKYYKENEEYVYKASYKNTTRDEVSGLTTTIRRHFGNAEEKDPLDESGNKMTDEEIIKLNQLKSGKIQDLTKSPIKKVK